MADDPNLEPIIQLMKAALTNDSFMNLVIGNFISVKKEFKADDNLSDKILILVEHVQVYRKIEKLIEEIRKINPQVYEEVRTKNPDFFENYEPQISQIKTNREKNIAIKNLKIILEEKYPQDAKDDNSLIESVLEIKRKLSEALQIKLNLWLDKYSKYFVSDSILKLMQNNINSDEDDYSNTGSLLIEIEGSLESSKLLKLKSSFWSDKLSLPGQCLFLKEERSITYNNLVPTIRDLISDFDKSQHQNKFIQSTYIDFLMVEVFLPFDFFYREDLVIEWLEYELEKDLKVKLCCQYPVVFRLAPRLKRPQGHLKKQWKKIKTENFYNLITEILPDKYEKTQNKKYSFNESKTICLGYKPLISNELKEILTNIYTSHTPIFIWSRSSFNDTENHECFTAIREICSKVENIYKLPELIRKERNDANANVQDEQKEKHIGHHICLLWDNPERMPPDIQKPENAMMPI